MIVVPCKPWKGEVMKVLMVAGDPISGEHYGGVEEHTSNLISHLFDIGQIDLQVLMFSNPDNKIMDKNIHYLKRMTGIKLLYPMFGILDVIRILKNINRYMPDIVHFQSTSPLFCITALAAQRKYNTILTMHGILQRETRYQREGNSTISLIYGVLSRSIEKYTLFKLEHLIVLAPQIQEIIKKIRTKRTYVVPNGVEPENIEKIAPAMINKENVIVFIGNLRELKGVHILIEALGIVKRNIPDIYLLIAGSGSQEAKLKEMALALGLENNVSFLGFIRGDERFSYIKAAKFLVLPSFWEVLPIVVLEGMACGKAIVASNVGGIPYLINDGLNGYLVQPGDVQNLADKIILLLEKDEILLNMSKENLKKVQGFSWKRIAAETCKIYSIIMNASKIRS
jgi:glycosyltransferase involved in cell wall biosynthesis